VLCARTCKAVSPPVLRTLNAPDVAVVKQGGNRYDLLVELLALYPMHELLVPLNALSIW